MCRRKKNCNTNKIDCPFIDIIDCPFSSDNKKCGYNKETCRHKNKQNKFLNWLKTNVIEIICLFVGVIFLFSILIFRFKHLLNSDSVFYNAGLGLSCSIISATLIALLIDIPNKIKEYQSSIIETLSSKEYLKKLTEDQLTELRSDVTDILHRKDVPHMPKGLIKLDEEICKYLKKPYYKYYRLGINCELAKLKTINLESEKDISSEKGKDYILKEVTIEYLMFNPYIKNHPINADIGFNSHIMKHDDVDINSYLEFKEFKITVDGNKKKLDLLELIRNGDICIGATDLFKETEFYNKKLFLYSKSKHINLNDHVESIENKTSQAGKKIQINEVERDEYEDVLDVYFKDKIKVEIKYNIYVPTNDLFYTKRLRYPVKYFRLDYKFKHQNVRLYGQLLGTLIDQSKIAINFAKDQQYLSIETFDWLLPRNGIIVVISSLENQFVDGNIEDVLEIDNSDNDDK